MSFRLLSIAVLFAWGSFNLVGCKQDDDEVLPNPAPFDFRDALVGNYVGTKQLYSWNMSNPIAYDTTFAYSFSVSKHPSATDSIIVDNRVYPIDTSLSYYYSNYPGNIDQMDFKNDSCLIYQRSGGLGGYSYTYRKGKKQ
jgi:hypothetical protein